MVQVELIMLRKQIVEGIELIIGTEYFGSISERFAKIGLQPARWDRACKNTYPILSPDRGWGGGAARLRRP